MLPSSFQLLFNVFIAFVHTEKQFLIISYFKILFLINFYQLRLYSVWLPCQIYIKVFSIWISFVKLHFLCGQFLKFYIKSRHLHGSSLSQKSSTKGRRFDSSANCSNIAVNITVVVELSLPPPSLVIFLQKKSIKLVRWIDKYKSLTWISNLPFT